MKLFVLVVLAGTLASQAAERLLNELPASATARLARSLEEAARHARHPWRDTPPLNDDGTVNAYVEISRGDRRKWEFDMAMNARAIDRSRHPRGHRLPAFPASARLVRDAAGPLASIGSPHARRTIVASSNIHGGRLQ